MFRHLSRSKKYSELSFTWEWKNEPGVESFVTVKLTPIDHSARMQFEHAQVGTASAHNYLVGWKSTFEKLERMLNKINDFNESVN
ncbi:MAG TPA: SRPBCC domain-containing protein [Chitinophagaceae bacterium]